MAKLIVQLETGRRREHELGATNTVGRHPMQTVQVLDPQVSKEHLVLERLLGGRWMLRDLGSLNGTFVNDELVSGSVRIRNRDRIVIGSTQMVFLDPTAAATGDHKVTIGDNLESSIYETAAEPDASEFLPVERIDDAEVLKRDYERLRLAARLNQEIALEVRQDRLLPRILQNLMSVLKADRGVILLAEQPGAPLEPRAVRVRGDIPTDEAISLSKTILNKVLKERTALITNDAQKDDRFSSAHSVILAGIRSTMCAPLITRDKQVIGVIHLDSLYKPNAFTERDLSVLQGVAQAAAIAIENSRLVERIEKEAVTRQKFEKMLSPNLVERVISGQLKIEKGGELRNVTVMFTDIRGFTELSEHAPPQHVVKLLNEYFELVVDIVFDFDGTLDKYIGDSVMAVWGAPVGDPDGPEKAARAAIEIQKAMAQFNELRRLDGMAELHTGIGIDTGEIVAGYMGSSKTMSYTVVGASVNRASRLCSAAGEGEILLSDHTYKLLGGAVEADPRAPLRLKGISGETPNWSVRDCWTRRVPVKIA